MTKVIRTIKGQWRGERVEVKVFRDSEAAAKFLCTGSNSLTWREYDSRDAVLGLPEKAGKYVWAGGKYHNVKSLDPSVLAHV
jgi:hypothetical protein